MNNTKGNAPVGKTVDRSLRTPGDSAPYFFHQGTSMKAYEWLGVHPVEGARSKRHRAYVFRVWAPNADAVSVVGDFCDWQTEDFPMTRISEKGVWECTLPEGLVREGDLYKYFIKNGDRELYKADPYGFSMQAPPGSASVVVDLDGYEWHDSGWMTWRRERFDRAHTNAQPINVYEVNLASWKKHADGSYLSYAELASELIPYVKQMGYTHIELMPISEYPFDGSWGYQVTGYYAPTARFGTPRELMHFVDRFHEAGLGVILDWVPAHFPKDAHGLYEFDGQPLYEYQDPRRMEHRAWGTRCFDVGREEVQSFLVSNAVYWAEKYHIDGLRVDAVASMLYLDYDRAPGDWTPNAYGGHESLDAIAFFQKLNRTLEEYYPDVMTVAEESTAWKNVTSFDEGGLGFTFKWNMGWMNDALSYAKEDPLWRSYHHGKITFPLMYAFSERFVLPISHDEVVYGKGSLIGKMPGDYDTKFAGVRAFLLYMMTQPGKKLLFMGSEIGQFDEWDHTREVQWSLTEFERHRQLQRYVAELNAFYLCEPALWEQDDSWKGFQWIDPDNREQSVFTYRRIDGAGEECLVAINFLPVTRDAFLLGVPEKGVYEEVFSTERIEYGGRGARNGGKLRSITQPTGEYPACIRVNLAPMSAAVFKKKV